MPIDTSSPTLVHVRQRIREEMDRQNISAQAVGEATGLGRPGISRILNGHQVPRLDTLAAIASALDVPISRFFAGL